ncbi:three-helix bundle dimerization domain-containing protein [Gordonia sp. NPDC058843]|uniref:three-helix bundle dimerization domain-containing protein n=1 Tax=Gordonia sp. NPDC058843 TaxID=3346648 RepID=UPI00368F44A6
MHASNDEQRSIEQIRSRVRASNPGRPRLEIDRTVDEAYGHFRDVRVRDFVPLLVERRVVESLREPAGI